MPWTKDNNNEFLRLLKELNHSVKSRQGADEEIPTSEARGCFAPKESELEGEGSRDRHYPYKFLHMRDIVGLKGSGLLDNLKKNDENYYSDYFTA